MDDRTVWRIVKWACLVQLFSAGMDYLVWLGNGLRIPYNGGYLLIYIPNYIPSWVLASLSLFYVIIIVGIMEVKKK